MQVMYPIVYAEEIHFRLRFKFYIFGLIFELNC